MQQAKGPFAAVEKSLVGGCPTLLIIVKEERPADWLPAEILPSLLYFFLAIQHTG